MFFPSPLRLSRSGTGVRRYGAGILLVALLAIPALANSGADIPADLYVGGSPCDGEIGPPIEVVFTNSLDGILPGVSTTLEGVVEVGEDTPVLTLRIAGLESAILGGPTTLSLGAASAGDVVPFSIPVQFGVSGRSGVEVTAEAANLDGSPRYARREGVYALARPTGVIAGQGGFLAVEQQAVERDIRMGHVSQDFIESTRLAVSRVEGSSAEAPPIAGTFGARDQDLNRVVQAPPEGYVAVTRGPDAAPSADITIQGNISWTDENGNTHPAYGAAIQIWDEDLIVDEFLATVATDVNGNYQVTVDDNDGIGQGDRDIYVKVLTFNNLVNCTTLGGSTYEAQSGVNDETPGGSVINWSFIAANTGTGPSMSIFQAATWIAAYVAFDAEGAPLASVDIVWPNGDTGSFYDGKVKMEEPDRWDWDTVHHEYGHYVMDVLNIENNPGGAHNIGDCTSQVRGTKDEGNRLAWGEGWPTYFGTSAQAELGLASLNVPRVGDVSYQDLEDGSVVYSLETQDNNGRGEDNEVTVQRLLWDLYDNNNDGRDTISRSDNSIWNAIKGGAGSPHILDTYWGALRSGQSNSVQLQMGEIASDHLVGPRLTSPTEGAIVSPSSANFQWQADVGCPSSYSGDSFDLVFYNANTLAKILTIPGINATQYSLNLGQLQTLIASSHDVIWAVEGYHSPSPSTGPYLGESFAIQVNQPPVADAGPDQPTVECASHTTTSVLLNGTGSSDPDGDALTYLWTATGVTFDDATSATPTGQFPKGTKVVTLTVSDGLQQDTDTVTITVVDTTDPEISCPSDITVECSEHGGTPADHPDLAPFFAGVSATDVCDPSPVISDDAPLFFGLGDTEVTFYATDADGNVDSCKAMVTVEDTTPPEIEVVLNREVLWPPNHKMADIVAEVTVTDICDPNPTFVLTSITSDEPDNGHGDGNFPNDIQEAAFGSPDLEFQLRSERMGGGDGRKYTIIYTASDMSDNSTPDTMCVIVPHDQSGNAAPSSGFTADGTWLRGDAATFDLLVFSGAGLDASEVDPRRAYVGNLVGALKPVSHAVMDANRDGLPDLVVTYSTADAQDLRQRSTKKDPIGLHYSVGEDNYLVSDIFAIGIPIPVLLTDYTGDRGEDGVDDIVDGSRDIAEESDPALENSGTADSRWMLRLGEGGFVAVEVFDIQGRRVRNLVGQDMGAGNHELRWDGSDDNGRQVPSGVYFYRVLAPGVQRVQKVVVAR